MDLFISGLCGSEEAVPCLCYLDLGYVVVCLRYHLKLPRLLKAAVVFSSPTPVSRQVQSVCGKWRVHGPARSYSCRWYRSSMMGRIMARHSCLVQLRPSVPYLPPSVSPASATESQSVSPLWSGVNNWPSCKDLETAEWQTERDSIAGIAAEEIPIKTEWYC